MRAMVYHNQEKYCLQEMSKPSLQADNDVILKMHKTTICGTDLHICRGNVASVSSGRILGHEGIGIVEEIGPEVKQLKPGDKVLISCVTTCAKCPYCRQAFYGQCEKGGWILGNLVDGCQAEYVRIPHADNSLIPVPDLSKIEGVKESDLVMLSDILPTAYEIGVLDGRVQPGCTLAIVGVGPVGLAAVITAQLFSPAEIIAIDMNEHRLQTALELGATKIINPKKQDPVDAVKKLSDGIGVDVAIEAVGIAEGWYTCEDIVKPGGNIAILGVHGKPATIHLERMWSKNFTLTAGIVHAATTSQLLKQVLNRRIPAHKLITHTFPFNEIETAYEYFEKAAKYEALKVIIEF